MKYNRRNFLKHSAILSGSVAAIPQVVKSTAPSQADNYQPRTISEHTSNMCGYAAPKISTVRVGFIGLGARGGGAVHRMARIEGVEIKALCDKVTERAEYAQHTLVKAGLPKAKTFSGENGWKKMVTEMELDLVYICTPWELHTPMCLYAMRHAKHVACEVPIALTIDECWELVETSEKTRRHCMMLENCCYDFFEMLTLNMARQGLFGQIVHAEGAYIHDLLEPLFAIKNYEDRWRLRMNAQHNGNLYPTHGLGPVAQCLDINRGDKMDYMVSLSTNDFMMRAKAHEIASSEHSFAEPLTTMNFRGNMNSTLIKTAKGKSIMIQHDVTSPRPYSRIHLISGTKGMASKWPSPERIAFGHNWVSKSELAELYDKYSPPLVKHVGEIAKQVGGHGGMDFMMDWRLIDCLRNGLPLDQDVYDGTSWSCIYPLSGQSIATRSSSVDIPDFTRGAWRINPRVNLDLAGGATTRIRKPA